MDLALRMNTQSLCRLDSQSQTRMKYESCGGQCRVSAGFSGMSRARHGVDFGRTESMTA